MRRNLRFWTRYTAESAAVVAFIMAIFLGISLLGANAEYQTTVLYMTPYYLVTAAMLTILLMNYGTQATYVPLLLSLGETRRNLMLGFHYYRALIIVATLAVSALIWAFLPSELSSVGLRSLPTILAVMVITSALGGVMGTLYYKCRAVATVLVVVIFGGFGGIVGFSFAGGGLELPLLVATAMKKYLRLARTDVLYMLVWQVGFYLFGMAMVLIINRFVNDDPDYACMGSFFALLGTIVGLMVRGNNTGHVRLRLAVTMGMTRRSFLICEPLITAVDVALALVFARVLYGLELALYQWLLPGLRKPDRPGRVLPLAGAGDRGDLRGGGQPLFYHAPPAGRYEGLWRAMARPVRRLHGAAPGGVRLPGRSGQYPGGHRRLDLPRGSRHPTGGLGRCRRRRGPGYGCGQRAGPAAGGSENVTVWGCGGGAPPPPFSLRLCRHIWPMQG